MIPSIWAELRRSWVRSMTAKSRFRRHSKLIRSAINAAAAYRSIHRQLLEIGAGGGSIAQRKGTIIVLKVQVPSRDGAMAAAATPTVTDEPFLGYLDPKFFNNGAITLDLDGAKRVIDQEIARPLSLTTEDAAWGVHLVATNNMEHAIRVVSVEQGRDPRRYAMVAFGGAGPLHAARLARKIGVPAVIVPRNAGVGSATGLLRADVRLDASTTRLMRLDEVGGQELWALYQALHERVCTDLSRLGLPGAHLVPLRVHAVRRARV